jgi:Tfp pilus assembly protein PilX
MTSSPRRPPLDERGIVLAAAIMFVLLSSVLVLTFMSTTTGERAQSSNVQTAKLALYAADAGVRAQQQILANMAQAKLDSCLTAWTNAGATGNIVKNPQALFPSGTLNVASSATSTNPPYSATASITFSNADIADTAQTYNYLFNITSTGSVRSTGRRSVQSQGLLRVSASRGSFADYLLFMDQFVMPDGSSIWFTSTGSFDGRVHTNTYFKYAFKPTFQDQVTQVNSNATFYNNGSPISKNAANNGTIDVPNFFGGYLRGQSNVPLPTNSYNQQAAALGLSLAPGVAPTNAQINTALGLGGTSTPSSDIYLPHSGSTLTGGFYIQGTVDKIKMWADTLVNKQYYQFTQGSKQRTVEVDPVNNTTKVWNALSTSGSPSQSYTGIPPNGVLYTNGSISSLVGPDRGSNGYVNAAVAENTKLLITASSDIVVNGDLTCDSYNNKNNVLGLFSASGSVRIGSSAPSNLNVDAFVMATGTSGQFAVDNYASGSTRGSMNLRGGVVAKYYGAFGTFNSSGATQTGYNRNWHYDRRGLIPPYYPTTQRFDPDIPSARTMAWKEI